MTDPRRRLERDLADNARLVGSLQEDHARLTAASEASNADDEHDPEGATIAWEREQLRATLARAVRTGVELQAALAALDEGSYGVCARCGRPIDPERLEALPRTRSCISCAEAGSDTWRPGPAGPTP